MNRKERKEQILQAGLLAAEQIGYQKITRAVVAHRAEISEALVQYHFNSIHELKREVMSRAIEDENIQVISQGLGMLDDDALAAPDSVKTAAFKFMAEAGA